MSRVNPPSVLLCFGLEGEEELGFELFLRECYFKTMQIIVDEFDLDAETLKDKHLIKKCRPLILTGTQGIGKFCFACFLLLHLLRSDELVFYQIETG